MSVESRHGVPRRFWRLVFVGAILIAVLGLAVGIVVWNRRREEMRRQWQVGDWVAWAREESADAAHRDWLATRSVGVDFGRREATPYNTLSMKYFGEGDYGEAFRAYEKSLGFAGKSGDLSLVYLAAVAGEVQWLRDNPQATGRPRNSMADRFRLAAAAWAASDRAQVMELTDPEALQPQAGNGTAEPGAMAWLVYLRARALAGEGRPDAAFDLLDGYVFHHLGEMDLSQWLKAHFLMVGADLAERAGRLAPALELAEATASARTWVASDVSWASQVASMKRMADRLRAQLGEQPQTKENAGESGDTVNPVRPADCTTR